VLVTCVTTGPCAVGSACVMLLDCNAAAGLKDHINTLRVDVVLFIGLQFLYGFVLASVTTNLLG
jgi:hypothetical protein